MRHVCYSTSKLTSTNTRELRHRSRGSYRYDSTRKVSADGKRKKEKKKKEKEHVGLFETLVQTLALLSQIFCIEAMTRGDPDAQFQRFLPASPRYLPTGDKRAPIFGQWNIFVPRYTLRLRYRAWA